MRRFAALLLIACVSACSALLGFEEGFLRSDVDAGGDGGPDGGGDDAADGGCMNGDKSCSGTCVSIFDTDYGCTLSGCTACPGTAHAKAICTGPMCGLSCDNGFQDCNKTLADGCEVDPLNGDPKNCGQCNRACDGGLLCNPGGLCSATCTVGTNCDGGCVDTVNNPNNCGSCNKVCPAVPNGAPACNGSNCTFTCISPYADCDAGAPGCETVISTDTNNCGACGHKCVAGSGAKVTGCVGGKCMYACSTTVVADCDGDLADGGACECTKPNLCRSDTSCKPCALVDEACGNANDCCLGNAHNCSAQGKCCLGTGVSCAGALSDSCCGNCNPGNQKCF